MGILFVVASVSEEGTTAFSDSDAEEFLVFNKFAHISLTNRVKITLTQMFIAACPLIITGGEGGFTAAS